MALKTDTDEFRLDVQESRKARRGNLNHYTEQVSRYHGRHFKSSGGRKANDADWPDNFYYQYITLMDPQLVYDSPRVLGSTTRRGDARMIAKALGHATNEVSRRGDMLETLDALALDYLLQHCVAMVAQEPDPSLEGPAEYDRHLPRVYRIDPRRFVIDANAERFSEARYMGHEFLRDLDDLIEEAKTEGSDWDKDALERVKSEVGKEPQSMGSLSAGKERIDTGAREECWLLEIWIPEEQLEGEYGPDSGFNGTIRTYAINPQADNDELVEVREPRMFYGPRTGPYVYGGPHLVPGEIDTLSELVAVEDQILDVNEQARYMSQSNKQYKRLVLVDAANATLQKALLEAGDSVVIPVPGLSSMTDGRGYVVAEVGGISEQQLAYYQIGRDRLDRNSGLDDASRGKVDPNAKATAIARAAGSSETRTSKVKTRWSRFVERVLDKVGWYLYHDDRVEMPMGDDAAAEFNLADPWWYGGTHEDGSGYTYDDLELKLEPLSMERTSDPVIQSRIDNALNTLIMMAQIMPQAPYIDWPRVLEMVGESRNLPGFEDLVDLKTLEQMMGVPMPATPQPRVGKLSPPGSGSATMGAGQMQTRANTPPLLGNLTGSLAAQAARL